MVHPFIHPVFFLHENSFFFGFSDLSQNGVQLQALKISQSLGDESSQVGFGGWKEVEKTLEDHPIPGWVTSRISVVNDVPMVSDFLFSRGLGCSRTPSKWPNSPWLLNGGPILSTYVLRPSWVPVLQVSGKSTYPPLNVSGLVMAWLYHWFPRSFRGGRLTNKYWLLQ